MNTSLVPQITLVLLALTLLSCRGDEADKSPELNVVEKFYKYLTNDEPSAEAPDIFSDEVAVAFSIADNDSSRTESASLKVVWEYLRSHKDQLLVDYAQPSDVYARFAKGTAEFPISRKFVVLRIPRTSPVYQELKEIIIPLTADDGQFFIELGGVTINGKFLIPHQR